MPPTHRKHTLQLALLGPTLLGLALGLASSPAPAQAIANVSLEDAGMAALTTTNGAGPTGIIPLTRGFNAFLITATEHDSSNGWATVLTPGLAFRFNQSFSVNASAPIYAYINILQTKGTLKKPIYSQTTQEGVPGDTSLDLQFSSPHPALNYSADASLGLPTGNKDFGLGAGQPTYDLNNHFERSFGPFTPDIELGFGDSSRLVGQRIRKSYTAVGPIAHFQAGASVDLPLGLTFESDAYEQLPLSHDTIYSTTLRGKKKVRTATTTGAAEDNGFLTSLDLPVTTHLTVSSFYNRSLRSRDDIFGLSATFFLRALSRHPETSR